ncbi:TPA: site-specific integrase [Vibrio parahaemolyticus]|nr:tyrosine-type recombinase/integrase [Vibrio parahaemolyticus]EIJ2228248.1 site-specific integrase [Vibrio parahaemolyticus]EKC5524016.1 site-specific integrase [Vibrio parahaemolyticus]EKL0056546.1 site-specific integrase [Vibrio parahaemolyticus]EKP4407020.1 site-specific integrase [Vibrio parahaemolyticus]
MATINIEKVQRRTGIKYKARVRASRHNKRVFEKSKTFGKKALALAWAKQVVQDLNENGIPSIDIPKKSILIGDLITLYLEDQITSKGLGRSKTAVLRRLRSYDIALVEADQLTATHLVRHCRERLSEPTAPLPQTVYQDVTYLRSVINVAGPIFGYKANIHAHNEAIPTLVKYGLIGRSDKRDRRPTKEELIIAEEGLRRRQNHRASHIPLVDIFHISIFTCMRLGEITRVTWSDLDEESATITIRDRKNPRNKKGNHCTIPLFPEALKIIQRQPKVDELIFPYKSTSIGAAWQRMCKEQGLEDLHYHDLRAEGACQLFERGLDIVEISKITGHRDINVLNNIYLRVGIKNIHQKID